jgi:hypothetical protein
LISKPSFVIPRLTHFSWQRLRNCGSWKSILTCSHIATKKRRAQNVPQYSTTWCKAMDHHHMSWLKKGITNTSENRKGLVEWFMCSHHANLCKINRKRVCTPCWTLQT